MDQHQRGCVAHSFAACFAGLGGAQCQLGQAWRGTAPTQHPVQQGFKKTRSGWHCPLCNYYNFGLRKVCFNRKVGQEVPAPSKKDQSVLSPFMSYQTVGAVGTPTCPGERSGDQSSVAESIRAREDQSRRSSRELPLKDQRAKLVAQAM
eukprot:2336625-Amphidinium_carterae.1